MNVGVIITAAGSSERFGPTSKLDQDIGGRALVMRTVELFTKREEVSAIIVAGSPDNFDEFKAKYGPPLGFHGATLVQRSRGERWETVKLALEAVPPEVPQCAGHRAAPPAGGRTLPHPRL